MANWADYWASLAANQDEANQGAQPQAARAPVSLSGAGSAYQTDPTGVGPPQGDVTRDDFGQPIVTHYNPQLFGTNNTAQNLAQQLGGQVISAPSREAGGGTPGSPWTMPDANYIRMPNGAIVNAGTLQSYLDAFGPEVGQRMIQQEIAGSTPQALGTQAGGGSGTGADYWYNQYGNNPAVAPPTTAPQTPQNTPPPASRGSGTVTGRGGTPSPRPSEGASGGMMPPRTAGGRTSLSGAGGNPASGDPTGGRSMLTSLSGSPSGGASSIPPGRTPPTGGNPATPQPTGGRTVTPPIGPTPPTQPTQPGVPPVSTPTTGQPSFPGTAGRTPTGTVPAGANPAFPNWSAGDGTGNQAYSGGDPGFMASALQNRAIDYGNNFENTYGGAYNDAQTQARQYQDQGDQAYNWLNENPGYNANEAAGITQQDRLTGAQTTQGEFDSNQLSDAERQGMMGDPGAVGRAFDPSTITSTSQGGTDWTKGQYQNSYKAAQDALNKGESTANSTLSDYGSRLRGAYGNMSGNVNSALDSSDAALKSNLDTTRQGYDSIIDPSKLGISDETVAGLKDQAGRQIGLQYGAAQDQLQRQAEAAGNVNPLSLAAARQRLLRSSSIDQADAVTNADLSAREAQRQANLGIADRRMTANTTLGQMGQAGAEFSGAQRVGAQQNLGTAGMGAESEIGNAGLNTNLSLAGLRTGTESAYGTLGANVGATSNAQNTAAVQAAGNTAIQQAGYQDTANAARNAAVAQNRQTTNQANQAAKYQQGYNTATSLSGANKAIGDARIQGQQAARNYWQGQGQYQGAQANAASSSRIAGAQTSLSGQGQGAQVGMGTEIGRRSTRPVSIGPGGITVGI